MKRSLLCLLLLLPWLSQAQQVMSLANAIDSALRNNLDIRIARNDADIALLNDTYGMAGGLPTINMNAGDQLNYQDIQQHYSEGGVTSLSGLLGNTVNAGLSADIVLFNGCRIVATKKRLDALRTQSEIELNAQVQDVLASVMLQYYEIVRQQSYLRIMQSMLEVSQKKVDIVHERDLVGLANGAEIMQAQSDLNTAEQNLVIQQMRIEQEKIALIQVINAKPGLTFLISDTITCGILMPWDSIASAINKNPGLLSAEQQIRIREMEAKESAAQKYPSLELNAGYNFLRTDNSSGGVVLNQYYGPNLGLSLHVPIFNGNIYRTQKKVADLRLNSAMLEKDRLQQHTLTAAMDQYIEYTTALKQIELQQQNLILAEKLLKLVLENFSYNQATILELKAAQSSFESAAYLLVNYQYAAKSAEIGLKQMMGVLVK
jgi:outer membrane protein TolC